MRSVSRVCGAPLVARRAAARACIGATFGVLGARAVPRSMYAAPLTWQQQRTYVACGQPTVPVLAWYSFLFGSSNKNNNTSNTTSTTNATPTASQPAGAAAQSTTASSAGAPMPAQPSEDAMKPQPTVSKESRLKFLMKIMRAAIRRLQEAQARDVEGALTETRTILSVMRRALQGLVDRVRSVERFMRRQLTGQPQGPALGQGGTSTESKSPSTTTSSNNNNTSGKP